MPKIKILYGLEAAEGGSLKHLMYLVRSLDKQTFHVTVILSPRRKDVYHEVEQLKGYGAKVITLNMGRGINLWKDIRNLLIIYKHIAVEKYDIVHAHSSKAGFIFRISGWLNKTPLVLYTPHCFYFQACKGTKGRFFAFIEKWLARITNFIIVAKNEKIAALEHAICQEDKLLNINNAIDVEELKISLKKDALKQEFAITSKLVVGAIGRLTPQKDWLTFIRAADKVLEIYPDVTFIVVGSGELEDHLLKSIFKLKRQKSILFLGYVQDINKIYKLIDIFVSTSLWEGLPYTFLEAMTAQKAVVTTNVGQSDLLINNVNSLIVPRKNPDELARKICQLIDHESIRISIGKEARARINRYEYTLSNFIKEHEKLYSKLRG